MSGAAMSDKVWLLEPHFGLFDRNQRVESHEAWDWFTRGCPDVEAVVVPGIMDEMRRNNHDPMSTGITFIPNSGWGVRQLQEANDKED